MKKLLIIILCFLNFTLVANAQNRAEILRNRILKGDTTGVLVVAHRGDWRYAPENSRQAIEHSIKVGVDIVELDLQLTKDSILIIMHDDKLERTTSGNGFVNEHTLADIKKLRLRNGCGICTHSQVPTLEEALLLAKGRALINLDKADRYFDLLMPVLEKTGTTNQIIMKGQKPAKEVLDLYGKYLNKVIYMPVVNLDAPEAKEKMKGYMKQLKPAAYELCYPSDNMIDVPLKIKKDLKGKALIWYNTLWDTLCGGHDDDKSLEDCDASFGFLIDSLGARIIQTDRAEHLLKYLRSRGLHK